MLRNWAIAEASSIRRWRDIHNNLPQDTAEKINKKNYKQLTPTDHNALEEMIVQIRAPLLKGLLPIKPQWYKGYLSSEDLMELEMMNWPDFVNLANSRRLLDLVKAFEEGKMPNNHHEFAANLDRIRDDLNLSNMVGSPIILSRSKNPPYYLVEGFTRCSAILMNMREGKFTEEQIPIMLGVSDRFDEWYLNDDKKGLKLY